ncbi:MAG: MBL fold metallo-hydrolase [Lachnospiraceae bacterium]|nr:MBL fold metallo-hydrolase [Lachnospiraceae bacterium]
MHIHELKYSNTNTYLIEGDKGRLLFDTGWAGTFPAFCRLMGDLHIPVQDIDYILISHFHPDHMGIAQDIADLGARIAVADIQQAFVHSADSIFAKDAKTPFRPLVDEKLRIVGIRESRDFLRELGIAGEIVATPGHSDDSISLCLDEGAVFVGDLNPLYELELHKGTQIAESWNRLLKMKPKRVYYGHAKAAELGGDAAAAEQEDDRFELVSRIMKYIDRGMELDKIAKKTGAGKGFVEDVARMYLTHQNVGVQGILDRIEIKGR